MTSIRRIGRRYLGKCYWLLRGVLETLKAAVIKLTRTVRSRLLLAKFPLKKEFLILNNASYTPGLFSEFTAILGLLDHRENWKELYAGLKVDFEKQGLYYEPAVGNNWWEYYFEPIDIGTRENATEKIISTEQHVMFSVDAAGTMSRKRGFELINKYVRVKSHIRDKVESFIQDNFGDTFVIGIHYRGTDKKEEAPRVPYEEVFAAVCDAINVINTDRYKLFLATDEQAFLNYMLNRFPDNLTYYEASRSLDEKPVHARNRNNHRKGEEAVIDCVLLSRCNYLVRTASNLSLCSTLFNPLLPEIILNSEYK